MRLKDSLGRQILEIRKGQFQELERPGKSLEHPASKQSLTQMVRILSVYPVQAITHGNLMLRRQSTAFTDTFVMLIPAKYLTHTLCIVITCLVICWSSMNSCILGYGLDSLL